VLETSSNILIAGAGGALLPSATAGFTNLVFIAPQFVAECRCERKSRSCLHQSRWRVSNRDDWGSLFVGERRYLGDLWLISAKDPTRRVKLPKQSRHSLLSSEFHSSPNEEWILGLRHVGSGLQNGDLYHRVGSTRINMFDSFSESAWESCLKLKALDADYSAEGVYAMTYFVCWSFDSSRLLVQLRGARKSGRCIRAHLFQHSHTTIRDNGLFAQT
jgi:hypothetical protein